MTRRRSHRGPRPGSAGAAAALLVALPLVDVATGCARRDPRAHAVAMRDFGFQPDTLTVAQGDTIVWTNGDIVPHTATARDGAWDSGAVPPDGSWRMVAERPGRQAYYCVYHPNMRGTIDVR